jgi:hypothetical protein
MNKSLILLVLLAVLVGVAVFTKRQKDARLSEVARRGVQNREFLVPGLDVNAVRAISIRDNEREVLLKQGSDGWAVEQRGGYPVDLERLSRALTDLRGMKIGGKQIIGRGAWAADSLLEPAEGVTEGVGTHIRILDDKDTELAALVLGGDVETSGANSPMFGGPVQRLVRIPADEDTVWTIGSTLGEFQARPEDWLDKAFFNVEKMKSLAVTPANKDLAWEVARASEDETDYTLQNQKPKEEFDASKLSLTSLLSAPSFNDVKSKSEAADLLKDAATARIATFEGFTYDLQVAKVDQDGASKYYLAIAVQADIPKERKAGENESEEDKTRLDEEFKNNNERLTEKLEKEQKLSQWVYEVAEYTVNNLLLTREDITNEVEPEPVPETPAPDAPADAPPTQAMPAESPAPGAPAAPTDAPAPGEPELEAAAAGASAAPAMKEPVTVTTPPIAVPPLPKTEVKPAPAPDANPAEQAPPKN